MKKFYKKHNKGLLKHTERSRTFFVEIALNSQLSENTFPTDFLGMYNYMQID